MSPRKFTALMLLLLVVSAQSAQAQWLELDNVFSNDSTVETYIQGNFSGAFPAVESGGFNRFLNRPNTGDSRDDVVGFGGAIGLAKTTEYFRVRGEVEGMWREDSDHRTSTTPFVGAVYQVKSTDNWSVLTNLWVDVTLNDSLWLYGGGGIGAAGTHLNVNDQLDSGQKSDTDFAYQLGTGLILAATEDIEIDFGYRFLDAGQVNVPLVFGVFPAGNYTADLVTHQIMLSVRVYLW